MGGFWRIMGKKSLTHIKRFSKSAQDLENVSEIVEHQQS